LLPGRPGRSPEKTTTASPGRGRDFGPPARELRVQRPRHTRDHYLPLGRNGHPWMLGPATRHEQTRQVRDGVRPGSEDRGDPGNRPNSGDRRRSDHAADAPAVARRAACTSRPAVGRPAGGAQPAGAGGGVLRRVVHAGVARSAVRGAHAGRWFTSAAAGARQTGGVEQLSKAEVAHRRGETPDLAKPAAPTVTVGCCVSASAEGVAGQVSDACQAASRRASTLYEPSLWVSNTCSASSRSTTSLAEPSMSAATCRSARLTFWSSMSATIEA
jgi:hypothetical protein